MSLAAPRPLPLPADAVKAEEGRVTPGAPPWLWIWGVLFLINMPAMLRQWQFSFGQVAQIRDSIGKLSAEFPDENYGRLAFLSYPSVLLDFLPSAALLVGLAAALFPAVRGRYVQKHYDLAPVPRDDKRLGVTISEIETFVNAHAPGLSVMWSKNLNMADPVVFPTGYRRSSLAINAKLLVRWQRDPEAARAVLLHEIGHYHRGDGLIIGVGSVFETVIRYAVPAFLILFVVPFVIQFVDRLIISSASFAASGMDPETIQNYQLEIGQMQATSGFAIFGSYLCWFVSFFVAPVAAIWAAEFGADRFAADNQGTPVGITKIIATEAPKGRWRWVLDRLTHPPAKLRLWMLERRIPFALASLALLLPVAYVLTPFFLQGYGALSLLAVQVTPGDVWTQAIDNTLAYFHTMPGAWLLMAAVLVCWPFIVRRWETMMTGEPGISSRSNVPVYWFCAVSLIALALVGSALGGVLESRAAAKAATEQAAALESTAGIIAPAGPAGPGVGASRDLPAPLGTAVTSDNLGMSVAEVVRGDRAWAKLQEASMAANKPPAGEEYVLVRVHVRNAGDEAVDLDPWLFGLTASGNVIHQVTEETPPDPWLDMTVAPGEAADGWVVLSVGKDETHRQLVYLGDPFQGQPVESWRYLALEDDATLPPGEPMLQ